MSWRRRVVGAGLGYAVAGPVGAIVGVGLAGGGGDEAWHDLSDVPFGLFVEAEVEDDEVGRRFTLIIHSEIPSPALARLQLRDDAGQLVAGHAPFRDAGGQFAVGGPIEHGRAVVYAPFGAADIPEGATVSLEVTVFSLDDALIPVGRATLDGKLPAADPWDRLGYLEPVLGLLAKGRAGISDERVREELARLLQALGIPGPIDEPLLELARHPPRFDPETLLFRYPSVDAEHWRAVLEAVVSGPAPG
ncbi:MAG: hypothetical protein KC731_36040 [Myxococcales bacterium]|nr:hypothetical protein [Myxococcales bacterium]